MEFDSNVFEFTPEMGAAPWLSVPTSNGKATIKLSDKAQFFRLRR